MKSINTRKLTKTSKKLKGQSKEILRDLWYHLSTINYK